MLKRTFAFFLLLLAASICSASTIHIVYPEGSRTYQELAQQLKTKVTNWQNTHNHSRHTININNNQSFSMLNLKKGDMVINFNNATLKDYEQQKHAIDILYTFTSPTVKAKKTHAYVYINQPIKRMLDTAQKTINTDFNKTILTIVSENNTSALAQLTQLKSTYNINVITIKKGDIAARVIEKEFYTAGAIVALYDPLIWSGNSARWLLQQAYNYRVPIIGYSKSFLKAGALASVYSTADDIIQSSYESTIYWIKNGKFSPPIRYPEYKIEVNPNIARALGFNEAEIIAIGEKQ